MVAKKAKAPRNKTIELSRIEMALYLSQALNLKKKSSINEVENQVICQDCLQALDFLPEKCVDLMVVDPPYNLTKSFGKNIFKEMSSQEYLDWLDSWLSKTVRLLKDNSSVYICSDWKTSLNSR